MAGAHCAASSFSPPYLHLSPPPKKPILFSISSISTPSRSKLRRRKNHLRQKLTKTLTKPYSNPILMEPPLENFVIPVESLHEEQLDEELVTQDVIVPQEHEVIAGVLSGELGKNAFLKLGLYLVGVFVFQTICAVWVFGSSYTDHEKGKNMDTGEKARVSELGIHSSDRGKRSLLLSEKLGFKQGGNGYLSVSGLEEKLVEIQAMARDVRKRERLKSEENGNDNVGVIRTKIEKEVDSKLVKLKKNLQNSGKKMLIFQVNGRDNLEKKEKIEPLMIKKKYKFRSPSGTLSDKPKGFSGSEDHSISKSSNNRLAIEDKRNESNYLISGSLPLGEDSGRKQAEEFSKQIRTPRKKPVKENTQTKYGKENRNAKSASGIGASQKTILSSSSVKEVKLRESSMSDAQTNNGRVRSNRTAGKVKGEQSKDKTEQWWLSLPFVLAILMRRGDDGVGPRGLFTLKSTPYTSDKGDLSHTVAFEDRGDATNFCHLLESFFEDLGDFSADIVPLSIKELEEEVRSHTMKVIVVKKGQLTLYAGQPLVEVEMALRSLVK